MKKILLLFVPLAFAAATNAQQMKTNFLSTSQNKFQSTSKEKIFVEDHSYDNMRLRGEKLVNAPAKNKKTRATPFFTETFSSLPATWTVGQTTVSSSWKWRNAACTGTYNIGTIASTTAANGWMVYDSDSIGSTSTAASFAGWLTSPVVNCTGRPSVQVSFQQKFRKFTDSCYLDVSNNGGTSWTSYSIPACNSLSNNGSTNDPEMTSINVSTVAANQANVKFRFYYKCNVAGGSYNWLVDDVAVSELDPVEYSVRKSSFFFEYGGDASTYSAIPKAWADSIFPFSFLSNNGSLNGTNVTVNGAIVNTGTNSVVQTLSKSFATFPAGKVDSGFNFAPNYKLPKTVVDYALASAVNVTGDAVAANNIDSTFFSVTDSIYTCYGDLVSGGYYIHRPSSNPSGEASYSLACRLNMPITDTLSGIRACFGSSTTVGAKVVANVYKVDAASQTVSQVIFGETKTLAASDISTSTGLVFTRLDILANSKNANGANLILDSGVYFMVIEPVTPSANQTIVLNSTADINEQDGYGAIDTAGTVNAFGTTFWPNVYLNATPIIIGLFSTPLAIGTNNISSDIKVNVAPNPATDMVNFELNLVNSAKNIEINLTTVTGQVVKTSNVGSLSANTTKKVAINTQNLAKGLYIYTINADGKLQTGKLTIQ